MQVALTNDCVDGVRFRDVEHTDSHSSEGISACSWLLENDRCTVDNILLFTVPNQVKNETAHTTASNVCAC